MIHKIFYNSSIRRLHFKKYFQSKNKFLNTRTQSLQLIQESYHVRLLEKLNFTIILQIHRQQSSIQKYLVPYAYYLNSHSIFCFKNIKLKFHFAYLAYIFLPNPANRRDISPNLTTPQNAVKPCNEGGESDDKTESRGRLLICRPMCPLWGALIPPPPPQLGPPGTKDPFHINNAVIAGLLYMNSFRGVIRWGQSHICKGFWGIFESAVGICLNVFVELE